MIDIEIIEFLKGISKDMDIIVEINNEMQQEGLWIHSEKKIQINEEVIKQSAKEKNIETPIYALIIFSHELGHAADLELAEIDEKMSIYRNLIFEKGFNKSWMDKFSFYSLRAEENAWSFAENFIDPKMENDFKSIKKESLSLHKQILKYQSKLLKKNNKASIEV